MAVTRVRILLGILVLMVSMGCRSAESADVFSGARAFEHVKAQVELGPRPPGSEAAGKLRAWLRAQLEPLGFRVEEQAFEARTPRGKVRMVNVVARLQGEKPRSLVLGAHYDTKLFEQFEFLGANDGASGVAALVELGRVLSERRLRHGLTLAFFDGEEALVEWGPDDGLYGSTHLVDRWVDTGEAKRVAAVFVLDMVGDRSLRISDDLNSHPQLRSLVQAEAKRLGHGETFSGPMMGVEDDHVPFLTAGIPAVDVIGFSTTGEGLYPPYWHTAGDTLDKVSPQSLEAVGRTVESCLRKLDGALD